MEQPEKQLAIRPNAHFASKSGTGLEISAPNAAASHNAEELQRVAHHASQSMYAQDLACQAQGIVLRSIEPGRATMTMQVRANMVNGHNMCHGGFVFLLADSAFAYACNSYGHRAVASSASIEFLAAGALGDTLQATATMMKQGKRSGLYDIIVTNQNTETIALFRGRSATIKGSF
jgi:acyl-CoA thioesterase